MSDTDALLAAIDLIYGAALDDSLLEPAMKAAVDFCGATGGARISVDAQTGAVLSCRAVNVDPHYANQYQSYYSTKDIRVPPALSAPVGAVLTDDMLIDPSVFRRTEIYNDLLLPAGAPYFMFSWTRKDSKRLETFALEGTLSRGAFEDQATSRYGTLLPHLRRALAVKEALDLARQARRVHEHLLDRLPFGVIALDAAGRVLECSKLGAQLLDGTSGLAFAGRRLRALYPADDRKLQQALAAVHSPGCNGSLPGETLRLRPGANGRSLLVTVIPVSEASNPLPGISGVAGLVMVVDPGLKLPMNADALQKTYGLTGAETNLALALSCDGSLRDAALSLGISVNTAKTQLKCVYAKTRCRRQAELMRVMMMISLTDAR